MEEKKIKKMDTATEAEQIILRMKDDKIILKTNQIRKFLAAVNALSNKVNVFQAQHPTEKRLPDELVSEIKYLKVKFAYQAGRNGAVKQFGKIADIKNRIDRIGTDLAEYREFAQFMEALVAYHKFHGGKDN